MEHTNLTRRVASGLTAALLATGALTGVAVAAAPPAQASAPAASDQAARFEVDFLTGMIDHHHMAVMMAEMCVEKAVHDQLAATCESIVATQSAEIATMQQWLEDWYGISHEPDMTGMQSMHRFHDLDGEEFEVAFLRSMIRHHRGAIREAEKCLANAEHDELLTLSHSAIDRSLFAKGAVAAAAWVRARRPGLYDMQDVLGFRQA